MKKILFIRLRNGEKIEEKSSHISDINQPGGDRVIFILGTKSEEEKKITVVSSELLWYSITTVNE